MLIPNQYLPRMSLSDGMDFPKQTMDPVSPLFNIYLFILVIVGEIIGYFEISQARDLKKLI